MLGTKIIRMTSLLTACRLIDGTYLTATHSPFYVLCVLSHCYLVLQNGKQSIQTNWPQFSPINIIYANQTQPTVIDFFFFFFKKLPKKILQVHADMTHRIKCDKNEANKNGTGSCWEASVPKVNFIDVKGVTLVTLLFVSFEEAVAFL